MQYLIRKAGLWHSDFYCMIMDYLSVSHRGLAAARNCPSFLSRSWLLPLLLLLFLWGNRRCCKALGPRRSPSACSQSVNISSLFHPFLKWVREEQSKKQKYTA